MKVLFDQCTPEELREKRPEHDIQTADEAGMGKLGNGDLIDEAVRLNSQSGTARNARRAPRPARFDERDKTERRDGRLR